jgi:Glycosyltransferase Family 4
MQRAGVPWVADVDGLQLGDRLSGRRAGRVWSRAARRLVLAADVVTCGSEEVRQAAFERLHASPALIPSTSEGVAALDRSLRALMARGSATDRLRILMLGPVNSPHMEHLALAMAQRGHLVAAGGAVWGGGLPPSSLPEMGITVSAMTWPQPLWLRRLVRSFRPHVVHANWMPFAVLATLAGVRPLVAMAWGSDVYLAGRVQRRANRFALARADAALADSSALVERLRDLGAPRDRLMLLNWGVDLARFKPATTIEKRELKLSLGLGEGPVVISPRGFKDLYNPAVVLAAFERILAEQRRSGSRSRPVGGLVARPCGGPGVV